MNNAIEAYRDLGVEFEATEPYALHPSDFEDEMTINEASAIPRTKVNETVVGRITAIGFDPDKDTVVVEFRDGTLQVFHEVGPICGRDFVATTLGMGTTPDKFYDEFIDDSSFPRESLGSCADIHVSEAEDEEMKRIASNVK